MVNGIGMYRKACIVDTLYSLFMYLLMCKSVKEIQSTFYALGLTVPHEYGLYEGRSKRHKPYGYLRPCISSRGGRQKRQ